LYGVLIGAMVVCLVWLFMTAWRDESSGSTSPRKSHHAAGTTNATAGDQPTASDDSSDTSSGPDTSGVDPVAAHLERCRVVHSAQEQPLSAAKAAMEQWQIHIAAMNKLVLGVITMDQANQFWNQTRVGAEEHLQAFTAALKRYDERSVHCAPVAQRQSSPGLRSCERSVLSRNTVLSDARQALATWAMHVKHMNMLQHGMMTPHRAEQLWLQSWHEGQLEVDRYRAAEKHATALASRC
jgi:hypothetical protein